MSTTINYETNDTITIGRRKLCGLLDASEATRCIPDRWHVQIIYDTIYGSIFTKLHPGDRWSDFDWSENHSCLVITVANTTEYVTPRELAKIIINAAIDYDMG